MGKALRSLLDKPLLHLLLIAIVGLLAYSNTFQVPFHFDDTPNIVENYKLRDLSNFWPPLGSRWFGYLTFALNYKFGSLNTTGYHIVNLTIHILNAILVYFLVVLTFKIPYLKVSANSVSVGNQLNQLDLSAFQPFNYLPLFIALLFVSHPIQTQAVTYITQRFTSLTTFFYMLSLISYVRSRLSISYAKRYMLYAISLISAILAMKTKEIAFTLPFIIVIYEFSFFGSPRIKRHASQFLYMLPFLLTLLIIPLDLIGPEMGIYKSEMGIEERLRQLQLKEAITLSRYEYLLTQFRVIVTYIRLLFSPIHQNLDYDYPIYNSFFNPNVFLSFLFLLSIFGIGTYFFYHSLKKARSSLLIAHNNSLLSTNCEPSTMSYERFIAFGIFWFFITLSVESSIIPIVDVIYEHRLYLPSIGMFIAINTVLFIFVEKPKHKWKEAERMVIGVLVVIVIVLTGVTYARNIVWKDEITLWGDAVKKSPKKARGYTTIGIAYLKRNKVDNAIDMFNRAIVLDPNKAQPYNELGLAYMEKGRHLEAVSYFEKALAIEPNLALAHSNLGNAFDELNYVNYAIIEYKKAIAINPKSETAHYNLGRIYYKKKMFNEAVKEFEIAIFLNPLNHDAKKNLELLFGTQ